MTPLLSAEHLSKVYVSGKFLSGAKSIVHAVDDISLEILPGRSTGIVGESGCGKSTLARLLCLLISPTSGQVLFRGKPVERSRRAALLPFRKTVQIVFQDPASSLNPRQRIMEILSEPLIVHGATDRSAIRNDVIHLADQVGIARSDLTRYPHEFSGGQRQRIGIARALATDPELLIADEPLSALDLSIQAQIINLLNELKRQRNLTLVMISHDLTVMPHLVDTVAVMYRGRIVEYGRTEDLLSSPLHPYTISLLQSVPTLTPASRPAPLTGSAAAGTGVSSGCPFLDRCPSATPRCAENPPFLQESGEGRMVACHHPPPSPPTHP